MSACNCCSEAIFSGVVEYQVKVGVANKCGVEGFTGGDIPNIYKTSVRLDALAGPGSYGTSTLTYTENDDLTCTFESEFEPADEPDPCTDITTDDVTDAHQGTHCSEGPADTSYDLSDIDATVDMVGRANTRLAADAWTGTDVNDPGAENFVSLDETGCFFSDVRYRLVFPPASTCKLTLWVRQTVSDLNDINPPVVGLWVNVFQWTAIGDPCFDTASSAADNSLVSPWIEVDYGGANTLITLEFYFTPYDDNPN